MSTVETGNPVLSVEAQIADHMAKWMAGEPFSHEVRYIDNTSILHQINIIKGTATRTYLPEYTLQESDRPRISVVPVGMTQTRIARRYWKEDYTVDTIVHQRIDNALIPTFAGQLPEESVEERQGEWQDNFNTYCDAVTKLADEVRMAFESRGCCGGGAIVQIPGLEQTMCARWLHCNRQLFWTLADVSTVHVLFCNIRHSWVLYRRVLDYA